MTNAVQRQLSCPSPDKDVPRPRGPAFATADDEINTDARRVFGGRRIAIIGASPGPFGTILSQSAWLPVMRTLGRSLATRTSAWPMRPVAPISSTRKVVLIILFAL